MLLTGLAHVSQGTSRVVNVSDRAGEGLLYVLGVAQGPHRPILWHPTAYPLNGSLDVLAGTHNIAAH